MATRSTIAIRNPNGTVTGVYCHWDGYFAHNGAILRDHYQDESKIRELIGYGHISSLGPEIGERHPFSTHNLTEEQKDPRWKNWTTFYGRDRGENEQESETFGSWNSLLNKQGQEYNYLFVPGEGWYVENYGDRGLLAKMMAKETEESN
jgi:hypothetical protein